MTSASKIVLSVVPYFGGSGPAAHSPRERRLGYLRQTIANIQQCFTGPTLISVCNDQDRASVEGLGAIVMAIPEIDPALLPASTMTILQRDLPAFTHLYYCEGDQILSWRADLNFWSILNADTYLIPHRLEEPFGQVGRDKGPMLEVGGREFVVANDQTEKSSFLDDYYRCNSEHTAFGGAYLCSREFFQRVKYEFSSTFPVEHASGFDPFACARNALKTSNFTDFFVEHLSARDAFQQIAQGR
ncbi:MAG: hypothetical protein K1X79_14250 [Oligoflexia bacterium]|nr:hypothetical protein [Oligoflexia bacterium]